MISHWKPQYSAARFRDSRIIAAQTISLFPEQAIALAAALLSHEQKPHRITGGLLMALLFIAVGLTQILLYSACWAIGTAQGFSCFAGVSHEI